MLVVDDNPINCRILLEQLRRWQALPTAAESGPAALAMLESAAASGTPFALVLLDANMPEMDGFDVVERIAATRGWRHPR